MRKLLFLSVVTIVAAAASGCSCGRSSCGPTCGPNVGWASRSVMPVRQQCCAPAVECCDQCGGGGGGMAIPTASMMVPAETGCCN